MDLNDITVEEFKVQFWRVFPFLPEYDDEKLYNSGNRVYYNTTELFYDCIANGTIGQLPTDTSYWIEAIDSIENYVLNIDIENAFKESLITFNQSLFSTDEDITLGFLYLTAHYLSNDLKAAMGGATGAGMAGLISSRSVGNVSESYNIPEAYMNDPVLAFLTTSPFGLKYLSMVLPRLRGNVVAVKGATRP